MIEKIIGNSWDLKLKDEFNSPYMEKLKEFLKAERANHTIYPKNRGV